MLGSTLSNVPLSDKRFDFQFVNPPYGYEWNKDYAAVTTRELMQNNPSVRQRLGQRDINVDFCPENADTFPRALRAEPPLSEGSAIPSPLEQNRNLMFCYA